MKKQDLIKLAIVGMMAGTAALSAQGTSQPSPNGSCSAKNGSKGTTQPAAPQQAPNGSCGGTSSNGKAAPQPAPSGSCGGKAAQSAKRHGVDTSVHSNYSSSNERKASDNKSFDQKCGVGSCDNSGDGTTPAPKPPAPSKRSH